MDWNEVADRLVDWHMGRRPGPYSAGLEIAMGCNLRCLFCQTPTFERLPLENAKDRNWWFALASEAVEMGVRTFTVSGSGEPLTVPWWADLLEHLIDLGAQGSLITNGTLLSGEQAARLARIGWPQVCVSIDGPNALSHDLLRGPGAFDGAVRAMDLLRKAREVVGGALPSLHLNVLLSRVVLDHLDETAALAASHGARSISLSPLITHASVPKDLSIGPDELDRLRAALERFDRAAAERGVETNVPSLLVDLRVAVSGDRREILRSHASGGRTGDIRSATCWRPWYHIQVRPDGLVAPCCLIDSGIGDGPHGPGRVGTPVDPGRLSEVWYGPWFEGLRRRSIEGIVGPWCALCESGVVAENRFIREALDRRWPVAVPYANAKGLRETSGLMGNLRRSRPYALYMRRRGVRSEPSSPSSSS